MKAVRRTAMLLASVATPVACLAIGPMTAAQAAAVSLASPPIDGKNCYYANTWGAPRSGGRIHEGVDIIAAGGTPLYAPLSGRVVRSQGSLAGNQAKVVASDGTYFIFAHLSAYNDGAPHGTSVPAGTVIGYVGKTGNTSVNHLHFEVHPQGGKAVDPTPIVAAVNTCGAKVAGDAMKKSSPWAGNTTTTTVSKATTTVAKATTTTAKATSTLPPTTTTTIPPSTISSIGGGGASAGGGSTGGRRGPGTSTTAAGATTTGATTTVAPTTVAPTTIAPTTIAPTTVAPTTVAPTTIAPTTTAAKAGAKTFKGGVSVMSTSAKVAANKVIGVAVVGFPGIPASATSIDITVTMKASGDGTAAVWPCGQKAGLSTGIPLGSLTAGQTTSTRVTLAPGDGGRVCMVASASTTYQVSVNAYS